MIFFTNVDKDYILNKGNINSNTLTAQISNNEHSGGGYRTRFFLKIPDDSFSEITRRGDVNSATCYAHVRPAPSQPEKATDIQYWIFYWLVSDTIMPII